MLWYLTLSALARTCALDTDWSVLLRILEDQKSELVNWWPTLLVEQLPSLAFGVAVKGKICCYSEEVGKLRALMCH